MTRACGSGAATRISWPATFRSMASSTRCFTASR